MRGEVEGERWREREGGRWRKTGEVERGREETRDGR